MNIALNLIAIKTLVRKEIVRVLRIWVQTIVPPAITMTLYFIIFGNLIGRRIGTMGGFDYMQHIAPGLIMMSVITNSYGNVVSSFFGAKFGRHVEEMLVAPMSYATIIIGHVAGGVLRGLLVGGLFFVVKVFFVVEEVEVFINRRVAVVNHELPILQIRLAKRDVRILGLVENLLGRQQA